MKKPILLPVTSVSGTQTESDGSRLFNAFAAAAIIPPESKTTHVVSSAPGTERWRVLPTPPAFQRGVQLGPDVNPFAGDAGGIWSDGNTVWIIDGRIVTAWVRDPWGALAGRNRAADVQALFSLTGHDDKLWILQADGSIVAVSTAALDIIVAGGISGVDFPTLPSSEVPVSHSIAWGLNYGPTIEGVIARVDHRTGDVEILTPGENGVTLSTFSLDLADGVTVQGLDWLDHELVTMVDRTRDGRAEEVEFYSATAGFRVRETVELPAGNGGALWVRDDALYLSSPGDEYIRAVDRITGKALPDLDLSLLADGVLYGHWSDGSTLYTIRQRGK